MKHVSRWIGSLLVLCASAGLPSAVRANDYYIATNGNNNNDGSLGSPFATVQKAVGVANPGDTIYVRGGTYNLTSTVSINKTASAANPLSLLAYPDEEPIFDFSGQSLGSAGFSFGSSSDYWHVKGLTIQHAGRNGLVSSGDHNLFEQLITRNNRNSGFQLSGGASYNHVLNVDSYENYDPNGRGEDADGFALKSSNLGQGNIVEGSRAWRNSDDGWDFWESRSAGVLVLNSWSFDNGFDPDPGSPFSFNGDGNGFKLGHDSGSHILANVLVVNNRNNGIDINGNGYIHDINGNPTVPNGNHVEIYNSVSHFNNTKNWRFDEEVAHILKNNISLQGGSSDLFYNTVDDTYNSWNPGVATATTDDFVSTSFGVLQATLLRGPRQADGSLPELEYLKLAAGSDLIDAGVPVSFTFGGVTYNLPYFGSAPDLGAYEFFGATGLLGDYNNDSIVNAADYSAWRDVMTAAGTSLTNDPTPGVVDESDFAYWRDHFGESLGSGAGAAAATVPEPAALSLTFAATGLVVLATRRRSAS